MRRAALNAYGRPADAYDARGNDPARGCTSSDAGRDGWRSGSFAGVVTRTVIRSRRIACWSKRVSRSPRDPREGAAPAQERRDLRAAVRDDRCKASGRRRWRQARRRFAAGRSWAGWSTAIAAVDDRRAGRWATDPSSRTVTAVEYVRAKQWLIRQCRNLRSIRRRWVHRKASRHPRQRPASNQTHRVRSGSKSCKPHSADRFHRLSFSSSHRSSAISFRSSSNSSPSRRRSRTRTSARSLARRLVRSLVELCRR